MAGTVGTVYTFPGSQPVPPVKTSTFSPVDKPAISSIGDIQGQNKTLPTPPSPLNPKVQPQTPSVQTVAPKVNSTMATEAVDTTTSHAESASSAATPPNQKDQVVVCPDLYDPQCGVDNNTYPNPCELKRSGIARLHKGECDNIAEQAATLKTRIMIIGIAVGSAIAGFSVAWILNAPTARRGRR